MLQAAYCREHGLNAKTVGNLVTYSSEWVRGCPVVCVGSGHDQVNVYDGEYAASS